LTARTDIPPDELSFFASRLLVFLTSCEERRLLAQGLTRSLVAMKAEIASTRTVGNVLIQLLLNLLTPEETADRILNGPTNEVWIHPWLSYLTEQGVALHNHAEFVSLQFDGRRLTGATVAMNGREHQVRGDYYIAAVPVEVMACKASALARKAPSLAHLDKLEVEWI
jgi:hypothetical protein